jgi:hypothetical protein
MKDRKGTDRFECTKCSCDEYIKERHFDLCAFCEHSPMSHGTYFKMNLVQGIMHTRQ